MKPRSILLALLLWAATAAAKKPDVFRPARPFPEAAADFYPEVSKLYTFYQRWAAGAASPAEKETCRTQYYEAIRGAFNSYRTARRRELSQTGWPAVLELRCDGKGPRTCGQEFPAPAGQEWDTAGLRTTGRPLVEPPRLSPDRRRLAANLQKRGEGTAVSRIALRSRRDAAAIEQQIDAEQVALRRKLEIHSLPSDATLDRYPL